MSQSTLSEGEEWLSVSTCARALGISERQARRYAGRLSDHDRREAGHEAGRVTGALVRLEAVRKLREEATGQSESTQSTLRPDATPDTETPEAGREPDTKTVGAGQRPDATPDMGPDARLLEVLERENAFLRGQVEQHARAEAELRAALREALRMSQKALTDGSQSTLNASPQNAPQRDEIAPMSKETPQPMATQQIEAQPQTDPIQSTLKGRDATGFRGWLLRLLMKG